MSKFLASGGQSIGGSASASVLSMNIQDWSLLGWTGWISLQSKELSRVLSNTTVQKHQFFSAQPSLVTQMVKSLPAMQETWVLSLCQEDPLEKEMATHSSIIAWKIPWMEEAGSYSPWGCKELNRTEQLTLSLSAFFMVQLSHPYMTPGKTIALTIKTFFGKVMPLLFNMVSRFVIAFFPKEQASFNFMAAVTICSDFGAPPK